eukprot:TRINITY_DN29568_c0_g1_i1.p1 TRINITY_DN29568_c0_g1~~TRINITY_DN29568_c0_g1_i1.p1  ORF type:complete len:415 (+),score=133.80 TRINITY_DN29568_c0_g1_i1:54-1247(+)
MFRRGARVFGQRSFWIGRQRRCSRSVPTFSSVLGGVVGGSGWAIAVGTWYNNWHTHKDPVKDNLFKLEPPVQHEIEGIFQSRDDVSDIVKQNIETDIPRQFLIITGESGAGKSTLLAQLFRERRGVLRIVSDLKSSDPDVEAPVFKKLGIANHPGGIDALLSELNAACVRHWGYPLVVYIDLLTHNKGGKMSAADVSVIASGWGILGKRLAADANICHVVYEISVAEVANSMTRTFPGRCDLVSLEPLDRDLFQRALGESKVARIQRDYGEDALGFFHDRVGGRIPHLESILRTHPVGAEEFRDAVSQLYETEAKRLSWYEEDEEKRAFLLKVAQAGESGYRAKGKYEINVQSELLEADPDAGVIRIITNGRVVLKHRSLAFKMLDENPEKFRALYH